MVQARPGAHPALLPGPSVAWVSGFSGGGSDLTGAREAQERGRWSPTQSSSASVSPVAKVCKFALSSELEGGVESRERVSRGLGRPPDWEPRVAEVPREPTHSSCTPPEASPRPPLGHWTEPSWRPHVGSPHTLAHPTASAAPTLDRSSSLGCLAEASAHTPTRRRRNLSGEPRMGQDSPEPSGSGEPRPPPHQAEGSSAPST